jgi:hypothetical protein
MGDGLIQCLDESLALSDYFDVSFFLETTGEALGHMPHTLFR